jgi:hypothetical protein
MRATKKRSEEKAPRPLAKGPPKAMGARTMAVSSLGVVAAGLVAVFVNVLAARHYKRWDATYAKLYTLSPPTEATLSEIDHAAEDVEIFVFIGRGDPLLASVRAMLETYQSKAPRHLVVRYLDPDRDRAEFARLKVDLEVHADKAEEGRILSDAQIVVRRGKQLWYVHTEDLTVLEEGEDAKVRPRIEQALTGAIRAVLATDKPKVCFTKGHGEASIDDPEKQGLAVVKNTLTKDNFDLVTVELGKPGATLDGCRLVAIVGPQIPFKKGETQPIVDAVHTGSSLLLAAQPDLDLETASMRPLPHGLDDVAALAGVALDDAFAVEEDPALRPPNDLGLVFFARTHPHATTDELRKAPEAKLTNGDPLVPVAYARTMHKLTGADVQATELLVSSDKSFTLSDVHGFLTSRGQIHRTPSDRPGPLDLAVAAERKPPRAGAPPVRAIVVGTSYPFVNGAFYDASPPSIMARKLGLIWLSWLTARPPILDLPPKPTVQIALHLSEDDLSAIGRYVLLYMPFAVFLVGGAVWFRRRTTEAKRLRRPEESGE